MNRGYKVVRKRLDGYESACELWHTVDYALHEWSKPCPRGYPFLYIFDSLEAARLFWQNQKEDRKLVIFEAEYTRQVLVPVYLQNVHLPKGTLLVEEVKLIKAV